MGDVIEVEISSAPTVVEVAVPGQQGPSGEIVGVSVTMSAIGTTPTVTNSGTTTSAILDFTLPMTDFPSIATLPEA